MRKGNELASRQLSILWQRWVQPRTNVQRVLGSVAIGTLLGIGFLFPVVWWFGIIGIPILLEQTRRALTARTAGWSGWLALTVSSAWSLTWFWSVLPIEWLPVGSVFTQALLVGLYWGTAAIWLGTTGAVVGVGWWYLARRWQSWWWGIVPVLWVGGEVFGSWVFSLLTWHAAIDIAPHFSFGYRGYLLAHHDGAFWFASIAGVYGLSWLAVWVGYGGYYLVQQMKQSGVVAVAILFFVTSVLPIPLSDQGGASSVVAVVETEFTGSYRQTVSIDGVLDTAITAARRAGADHVLLPEDMRYLTRRVGDPLLALQLREQLGTSSVTIIDSGRVATDFGAVLRGVVYDNQTAERWVADKQYLVPQGEFLPTIYAGALQAVGYGPVLQEIARDVNYVPGPNQTQAFAGDVPGILFCFEGVTPWGVRRILQDRDTAPAFVAHPISHAWFHTPTAMWQQLDDMLRVQARWNDIPIVSAGNLAPSAVYYPSGRIDRTPYQVLPISDRVTVKLFTVIH